MVVNSRARAALFAIATVLVLALPAVSRADVNITGNWVFPLDSTNCPGGTGTNLSCPDSSVGYYFGHAVMAIVDNNGSLSGTASGGEFTLSGTVTGTTVRITLSDTPPSFDYYIFSGTIAANGQTMGGTCHAGMTGCADLQPYGVGSGYQAPWDATRGGTPTTTTVQCADSGSYPLKCTATVTSSASAQTPTGTVAFTATSASFPAGLGAFSASACTLVASGSGASCSVSYTPPVTSDTTVQITAAYSGDSTFSDSAGMTDVVPCPYSKTLVCPGILVSPHSNLTVGSGVTVTGSGWNPKGGSVSLSLPGGIGTVATVSQAVDANGQFTYTFPLKYFSQRSMYPHVSNGCTLKVVATQGSLTAQDQGTSPGIGHVAYALYGGGRTPPFQTGDVYCLGEDPVGNATENDVVVTIPADSSPPVPGLTPYQVAATPVGINFPGSGDGTEFKPSLFVGGTLCLGFGGQSDAIVVDGQVSSQRSCPAAFPARLDNLNVEAFGKHGLSGFGIRGNGCLDLAVAGTAGTFNPPDSFVGEVDCALQQNVGTTLDFNRQLFVDGSLRIANPFVTIRGEMIIAGSFAASAGVQTTSSTFGSLSGTVIVGDDAMFGLGPPYRGLSPSQKQEIQLLIDQYSLQGSMATQYGAILGRPSLALGVATVGIGLGLAPSKLVTLVSRFATSNPISGLVLATVGQILSEVSKQGDDKVKELTALIKDPPDDHFRRIARPAAVSNSATTVRAGKGLSSADARVLSALLSEMAHETQVAVALGTAVDRAGGAAGAGDTAAERRQIAAAVKYALDDAKLLDAQPKLLAAAARVLRSLPAGRLRPTAKDAAAFRLALRKHSFSATDIARKLGITAQQVEVYRLALLASPAPPRLSVAQIIGAPSFAAADRKDAALLRVFAKAAPQTVGLRESLLKSLLAGASPTHAG